MTLRELWDQAVKVGAEDFEVTFAEDDHFCSISEVEINLQSEEVRLI